MWRGIPLRCRQRLLIGLGPATDSDCLLTGDAKRRDRNGPPERPPGFDVPVSQSVFKAGHA
jgi:hypothetical protein